MTEIGMNILSLETISVGTVAIFLDEYLAISLNTFDIMFKTGCSYTCEIYMVTCHESIYW